MIFFKRRCCLTLGVAFFIVLPILFLASYWYVGTIPHPPSKFGTRNVAGVDGKTLKGTLKAPFFIEFLGSPSFSFFGKYYYMKMVEQSYMTRIDFFSQVTTSFKATLRWSSSPEGRPVGPLLSSPKPQFFNFGNHFRFVDVAISCLDSMKRENSSCLKCSISYCKYFVKQ